METIHVKTVDPISQELLRSAAHRGIELSWERFERLQPQDGFLRVGLSCPFGCLQGPCRIDPFGRGPGKGVCGLAREEMVAGLLLRLCLQGATEALADVPSDSPIAGPDYSPILKEMVSRALAASGQPDLSVGDIFKSSSLLSRPSASYRSLLSQALRLCLLTLGYQEQAASAVTAGSLPCTIGYTALANQSIRIGLAGQPSAALVAALEQEVTPESNPPVQLVTLGDWIALEERFLPIACTSGESELLVSSGAIHLLVAGPATDPGLISLCDEMNIPVLADNQAVDVEGVIHRARKCLESRPQTDLFEDVPPTPEYQVLMPPGDSGSQLAGQKTGDKIALIGGSDTPQVSLGKLPVELAADLSGKGINLAGWGDAALWILKNRSASGEQSPPFQALDSRQGALLAIKALAAAGRLDSLQGICFSGMKSCRELALSLGLAYLGCRVSLATPIPIQGSRKVGEALSELLQANGGQLRHFDHPATSRELSEWFTNP